MFLFYWLIGAVLSAWINWLWTRRKFYALNAKLPGPLGLPLLGMAPYCMRREAILPLFLKYTQNLEPICFSWLGPYPFVVVNAPEIAKDIFTSQDCVTKSILYKAVDNGVGKGLFGLKDPDWSIHRKNLNPAFSHKVLLSFIPIFNEEIKPLLKIFEDAVIGNDLVDVTTTFQDFTLNVAIRTTMGKSPTQDAHESKRNLLKSYHCIVENMTDMIFSPWLGNKLIRKILGIYEPYERAKAEVQQFIRELIEQKLSAGSRSESTGNKQIFIDLAIDLIRRGILSWQEVEDEANVMVFGAFETTARTIAHTLILLAMFPEYQQKLFEELITIFPQGGEFEVSYDNIQDMVYMDMVLNESMRVLSTVPIVARETTNEVKLSNGMVIPAGVQVCVFIYLIHTRKDIWGPEAHLFNPDNFLPSNMEGKHPYAFIPFTKGIRNCIGWRYGLLSVKVTLAKLLRNYSFSTDFQFKDLELVENIVLKLKHVPLLRVRKRNI